MTSADFGFGDVLIKTDLSNQTSAINLPTDLGTTFTLTLSASETVCKRGVVTIIDTALTKGWLDTSFCFETYGSSASNHPNIGSTPSIIDGLTLQEILEDLLAMSSGKITKSGEMYTYWKRNNTTVAFMLSAGMTGRDRVLP